jgi:multidrug efflux pump subunit AcrB
MNGLIAWMARHPVAANLLMVLILLAGLLSALTMKQEVFPLIELDVLEVRVVYPGAAPDEIEEALLRKIEEQLEGMSGIERVTSIAAEGTGVVRVELRRDEVAANRLDDVKSAVDRISLPAEVETPSVRQLISQQRVVDLVLYGDQSERTLRELAHQVKEDLSRTAGVSLVQVANVRSYEVSVEVAQDTLRALGLTLNDVAATIRRGSLDLPSGEIKADGESILLRAKGRRYDRADFEQLVVASSATGTAVRLRDIAQIHDGFRDEDLIIRYNGKPAAFVRVFRVGDEKVLSVIGRVKDYLEQTLRPNLPPDVSVAFWRDDSVEFKNRIELLIKNGAIGLLLVMAALTLFLDLRLAFWVSLGIFVSFIGTFAVMPWLGISLNMMSLFAFILAIGIVVDDAIVSAENIWSENERGTPEVDAAVAGAQRVAVPIILAVSTTIVAFVPLLFTPGTTGKFLFQIPAIIIIVVAISVIEAMFILPHHLAHLKVVGYAPKNWASRKLFAVRQSFDKGLRRFTESALRPALVYATRRYGVIIAASITIFLLTLGTISSGLLRFSFFPQVEGRYVTASLELSPGTTAEATLRMAQRIEQAGLAAARSLPDPSGEALVQAVYLNVGRPEVSGPGEVGALGLGQGNKASVVFELLDPESRSVTAKEFELAWREAAGRPEGLRKLTFASNVIQLGSPIQIDVSAPSPEELGQAIAQIEQALAEMAGVFDIRNDQQPGKQEIQFQLKPSAQALGLTLDAVSQQMRAAFFGSEAVRIQRGRDEVRVYVRLPSSERESLASLANTRIRTPSGAFVPLNEVAELRMGNSPSTIIRRDGRRISTIFAEVDSRVVTGQQVNEQLVKEVFPEVSERIPGFRYAMGGEQGEQGKTLPALAKNFVLAVFCMYALLALAFRSYVQPLIVLVSIPFGLVGAVIGHLTMGLSMGLTSLFGIIGLAGIIVNGSLVLIDFINEQKQRTADTAEAIVQACMSRFRPILLTAITTFLGIFPLIIERSIQAQFLIPLAVSIGVGVLIGTALQMLLTPALVMALEDFQKRLQTRRSATASL